MAAQTRRFIRVAIEVDENTPIGRAGLITSRVSSNATVAHEATSAF
jgi:hypothetical protein